MNQDQKNKIIEEITKIFSGQLSVLELIGVVYGIKPTMAEMINFNKFDKALIKKLNKINYLCKKLSLHFVVSTKKFIINSPLGIFEMVDFDDPRKGKIAVGISKSKEDALEGVNLYYKKTLTDKGNRDFGRIMGYPECCLDFGDYLCENSKGDKDYDLNNFGFANPAVESLKRSKNFAWQCNVFTESPLSYYPCSLDCQKSIDYVNKLVKILKKVNEHHYKFLINYLKKPVSLYWTCADRILLYGDFKGDFEKAELKYDRLESRLDSIEFYQQNDMKLIKELNRVKGFIEKGNKIIMRPNYFEIFKNNKKLFKFKKENKYIPILVKPNK